MKIAIYGTKVKKSNESWLNDIFESLAQYGAQLYIHTGTLDYLKSIDAKVPPFISVYTEELPDDTDYMLTLGGDGTILRAGALAYKKNVPIVGVNMGNLGFLASIAKENIRHALGVLAEGKMQFEQKMLLEVKCNRMPVRPIAINEVVVSRKDSSSMIAIQAYVNDKLIGTYRADGLIISTPTGSTGYSLSCGGPIITPDSSSIVLTPVAPHNLNVRPIIFRDDVKVYLKVHGREDQYLLSLDSCFQAMNWDETIEVCKSKSTLRVAKLPEADFFSTLKEKLGWGTDERN
ncbi:MAG: NAD kinase [Flavobacteriales bacterium]|nr:NAD kinase [Flavobacteriales bacterium]